MPAPSSPLARIRTIAWYRAIQSKLKTDTHAATADSLYEVTNDEGITPDQCLKWSKGERCSTKWIEELNKSLPRSIRALYEVGPAEEPLWLACRLPSTLSNPLAILMPEGEVSENTHTAGDIAASVLSLNTPAVTSPQIRALAEAVAAYFFAAESFVLVAERNRIDLDGHPFISNVLGGGYGSSEEEVIASAQRQKQIEDCLRTVVDCATDASDILGEAGIQPGDVARLAYAQFRFLSLKKYPHLGDIGQFSASMIPFILSAAEGSHTG